MAEKSSIEWTDATWNPVRGCSRVSPGCGGANHEGGCYAEKIAARFSDPGQAFHGFARRTPSGGQWTGKLALIPEQLDLPLRWRKPRFIFANSMSDLFHEHLSDFDIATVYAVAVAAVHLRGHTLQILTKRAARMRELLNSAAFWEQVNAEAAAHVMEMVDPLDRRRDDARATLDDYGPGHPPPGIWLGVSVEDQERADERIPSLIATPAAVRFISGEPLLGPVELVGARMAGIFAGRRNYFGSGGMGGGPGVDWVICGGESGPRARPMHPAWARSLRDQCAGAGVPFFFKQWGEWAPVLEGPFQPGVILNIDGTAAQMRRVGRGTAGAGLDGREHREFPRHA